MTFYTIKNIQCIFRKPICPILSKLVRAAGGITRFLFTSRGRANNLHICILEIKASDTSVSKVSRRIHFNQEKRGLSMLRQIKRQRRSDQKR